MNILKLLFKPSPAEAEFAQKLARSFKSLRVTGRGTVTVDVSEVQQSAEFTRNLARGRRLVEGKNSHE